jgi:hypothetical protein
MSTAAPKDGGFNLSNLKDKIEHPFDKLSNKLHNTTLHDVKVKAIHKKYVSTTMLFGTNEFPDMKLASLLT